MKIFKKLILLVLLSFLCSCTAIRFEKRHYEKGFYMSLGKGIASKKETSNTLAQERRIADVMLPEKVIPIQYIRKYIPYECAAKNEKEDFQKVKSIKKGYAPGFKDSINPSDTIKRKIRKDWVGYAAMATSMFPVVIFTLYRFNLIPGFFLYLLAVLMPLLTIALALISLRRIRNHPGRLTGEDTAKLALKIGIAEVIVEIGMLLLVLLFIVLLG